MGPAMAENSQGENGSCADLAMAASTTPATTSWARPPCTADRALKSRVPAAANTPPAAAKSPRSPRRVARKAWAAFGGPSARQWWAMSPHDTRPTSSQPITRVRKSPATSSSSIDPTNTTSRPTMRARPRGGP